LAPSGDEILRRLDFGLVGLSRRPAGTRQLQHGCVLTFAEIRYKDDLTIGKFQGIVVGRRPIKIHLPEPRDLVRGFPRGQKPERSVALNLFFKRKFCPGQQANRNARLCRVRKAARDRIGELS
jgi:hypothetical protein